MVVLLDCSCEPFTDVCLLQSNFTRPMWLEAMGEIRWRPEAESDGVSLEELELEVRWSRRVLEVE